MISVVQRRDFVLRSLHKDLGTVSHRRLQPESSLLVAACGSSKKMGLLFNVLLAVFAANGSFLFGYDSGVMTIVIQSPHFLHFFDTNAESNIIGAINATFSGVSTGDFPRRSGLTATRARSLAP